MTRFADVIAALDDLQQGGLIAAYAIAGAMAQVFWDEAIVTFDLDVLVILGPEAHELDPLRGIYEWAKDRGYPARAEHLIISGIPVQFMPAPDALAAEAVANAVVVDADGVAMRVVRPEYLIALWSQPPANTDRRKERAATLREALDLDAALLADLQHRYNF